MVGEKVKFVPLNMLKLTLIRHAKTNQISDSGLDYDRNLLPKGIKQGNILDEYFHVKKSQFDAILVSSANRTRQTFEIIKRNFESEKVTYLDQFYLCSYKELFDEICTKDTMKNILIIGHNFGISDLASYLSDKSIELRTSEVIELSFPIESWIELSKGMGNITDQFHPLV